jgi:hypothetical protein
MSKRNWRDKVSSQLFPPAQAISIDGAASCQSGNLQSEELDDFQLIEPDHRLSIDDRHRRALKSLVD